MNQKNHIMTGTALSSRIREYAMGKNNEDSSYVKISWTGRNVVAKIRLKFFRRFKNINLVNRLKRNYGLNIRK